MVTVRIVFQGSLYYFDMLNSFLDSLMGQNSQFEKHCFEGC